MRTRLFIAIILMALLHTYIGFQLLPYLHLNIDAYIIGISALLISLIIIPLGMSARFFIKGNQSLADILTWAGMFDLGLFSSLLILTFGRQLVLIFYSFLYPVPDSILSLSAYIVLIVTLSVTLIGFISARRTAKVTKVDIAITNLPLALNGFTIAQISDIHVGPTIKRSYLAAIVKTVNELDADMVAVTGDLVDGSVAQLSIHTAPLADLKSTYGSFFVLGNHEYYSGADAWVDEIRRLGLTVLLNQHIVINHNGSALIVAGITDYSGEHFGISHKSDPQAAVAGAPPNTLKILLAHQPRSADLAEKYGFALQLSGHTHGGQFWPWNLFVPFQQPFTAGLGRVKDMWVYTNRGTGYWGPPKRFGVPSEITHIRLVTE